MPISRAPMQATDAGLRSDLLPPIRVSLLGSTGSIGRSTLDVIRHYRDRFEVVSLGAHSNIALLEAQIA
ncbi:MAG TPA: hypothetical protein PKZ01_14630, partial [Candidatus Hydrogenedentes bacterium]|nr:hypothetical protein [Candidatus Hydrogenedentota bacterium]